MTETYFAGTAVPLTRDGVPGGPAWRMGFSDAGAFGSDDGGNLRHASGYASFVAYALAHGADPADLAVDRAALLQFLGDHPDLAEREEHVKAAALFLGNTLTAAHPYATWMFTSEPEVSGPAMSLAVVPATRRLIRDRGVHADFLDTIDGWPQAHRDDQEMRALDPVDAPALTLPTAPFVPPSLPAQTYRDEDGRLIDYGRRYPDGPPEDAYSRASHPERFAALPPMAEAMVTYLDRWYDIAVRRSGGTADSEWIEMLPRQGATVTLTLTEARITVNAGALFQAGFPDCGCDACDESVGAVAAELVDCLLGIAGGGLREHFPVGRRAWTHVALTTPDSRTGGSGQASFSKGEASAIRAQLATLDDGRWPAWPLRTLGA